jgi:hypothetical protein
LEVYGGLAAQYHCGCIEKGLEMGTALSLDWLSLKVHHNRTDTDQDRDKYIM